MIGDVVCDLLYGINSIKYTSDSASTIPRFDLERVETSRRFVLSWLRFVCLPQSASIILHVTHTPNMTRSVWHNNHTFTRLERLLTAWVIYYIGRNRAKVEKDMSHCVGELAARIGYYVHFPRKVHESSNSKILYAICFLFLYYLDGGLYRNGTCSVRS